MMNDSSFNHHNQLQVNSSVEDLFLPQMLPALFYDHEFDLDDYPLMSYKRSASQTHLHQPLEQKPIKLHKITSISNNNNNWDNKSYDNSSTILSFSNNSSSYTNQTNFGLVYPKKEVAISNKMLVVSSSQQASSFEASPRVGSMAQQSRDHIIAERKRREKLTQKFIALSCIIPGLKKMDKASVLGEAIKYVKQLQERVTKLEDEAKEKTMESAVYVKRSYVSPQNDDDDPFYGQTTLLCGEGAFPEIEARISEKDVLIKIHCDKKKRVIEKLISKIEELNLIVISRSSLAFGSSTLAVTIIAQMDIEFSMTATDLVKNIRTALK